MSKRTLPERLDQYRPSGRTYGDSGKYVLFGIDSDGCVDKGMRAKHGGPFPRAGIELFALQRIAEPWRVAWSFVNEIERRGCPRFEALAAVVDRVLEMPVVQEAEANGLVSVPRLKHLKKYLENVACKEGYGDNVLHRYLEQLPAGEEKEELLQVASWSKTVNKYVSSDCPYIPPYKAACEAIKKANELGIDCMIVSGTPEEHLRVTWEKHGLTDSILGVFGRESGKKDFHLIGAMKRAQEVLGRGYDVVIMFGDAPGDDRARLKAAEALGQRIAFMPIRVGYEEEDWSWFAAHYLEKGTVFGYTEEVERERIAAFKENLNRRWDPTLDITCLFR